MKHIISLSLKYIRRQKLRTVLTFLCVTLSVFILCSVGAYMGSMWQTLINQVTREEGSHEANISPWFDEMSDEEQDNAVDIIKNHAVVSDYILSMGGYSDFDMCAINDGKIKYIEFSDGENTKNLTNIYTVSMDGNRELNPHMYFHGFVGTARSTGNIFPTWLKKMGYAEGDTINFTLAPVTAEIDMESDFVKEIRQSLLDEFGTSVLKDDAEYENLEYKERKKCFQGGLLSAVKKYGYSLSDIPMKSTESQEPVEFSIKIDGFADNQGEDSDDVLRIMQLGADKYLFGEFFEKYPELSGMKYLTAFIRINKNIDFDDGMVELFGAFGFNKNDYYFMPQPGLNTMLLLLECRSVAALVKEFPYLIIMGVIILFAWLVARFVIDNAFEISTQERSSQYASLRIMGASKVQITTLVFTEALFYTITAVPIGMVTAYIICNTSFTALRKMGFQDFQFSLNPYFAAGGALLCISAIFISAYTSAMWASRKLSPAEALNFGKPKKKVKKSRKKKSKINLTSKQFLRRYTSKNIMRSKNRYIISTVTMTLGVMFFTFSLMLGLFFFTTLKSKIEKLSSDDFRITMDSTAAVEDAEKVFRNKELFSECTIFADLNFSNIDVKKTPLSTLENLHPYKIDLSPYISIKAVDRYFFDENIAELSGMTYDEFVKSGDIMYFVLDCGSPEERIYNEDTISYEKLYDDFYKKLDEPVEVNFDISRYEPFKITSVLCSSIEFSNYSGVIIPIDSELAKNMNLSTTVRVKVNGQENYEEAEKIFNDFTDDYKEIIYNSNNNYAMSTGLNEFVKSIIKIAISFIVSVWAVGVLSMVNSINTSVLNRSRELIMLRSIGMNKKQLRKTVVLESVMFSAVSSSLGTILAIGAFFVLMMGLKFKVVMLFSMSVGLILSIIVNIVIAMLASIPALKSLERAESLVKTFE